MKILKLKLTDNHDCKDCTDCFIWKGECDVYYLKCTFDEDISNLSDSKLAEYLINNINKDITIEIELDDMTESNIANELEDFYDVQFVDICKKEKNIVYCTLMTPG